MNFYIDFEATQPENEIIAIGAVAKNGSTFHSLVKPQLSSISSRIIILRQDELKQNGKRFNATNFRFYYNDTTLVKIK